MSDLENDLRQALAPVTAPANLWARVDLSTHQPRGVSRWPFRRLALAAAAALPLLAAGGLFYLRAVEQQPAEAPLAQTALAIHNHHGDAVAAADGVEVRRFAVDGTPATLVSLAMEPSRPTTKQIRQSQAASGLTVFEWTQQGRRFALVAARQTGRNACRLCHAV